MSHRHHWRVLIMLGTLLSGCSGVQSQQLDAAPSAPAAIVPTSTESLLTPSTAIPPTTTVEPALSPTVELPPWPPQPVDPWPAEAMAPWPTQQWSYSSPEAQGIDSEILIEMLEYLRDEETNFHGLMLIRNGYVVLEAYRPPYDAAVPHVQFSATKSIVSTLVGLAIRDGTIDSANQSLLDLFPGMTFDNMDANKEAVTVEDLLTMRGGFEAEGSVPIKTLDMPIEYPPGITFEYGNLGPRLLAATVQQATGMDTLDYARKNLFDPIGISEQDVQWSTIGGVRDGSVGLALTPRAMAKIGYLYLNQGMWNGEEVLPAEWITQSTSPHVEGLEPQPALADSYGYLWWIDRTHGYYAAVGHNYQLIIVMPKSNMVFVTTAGNSSYTLTVAMREYITSLEPAEMPLPENPEANETLEALTSEFGQQD